MADLADAYVRALAVALTRGPIPTEGVRRARATNWKRTFFGPLQRILERHGLRITPIRDNIMAGTAAPETMITTARLENVRVCVETVLRDAVPGDLIETGVWRGGTVIFMRGILLAHGVTDRKVWAADSFEGFPTSRRFAVDRDEDFTGGFGDECLSVGLTAVRANFERYGLLDDQVQFLPGWFSETLPNAPLRQLAVLRLDGDLYESTWDALVALEPKLSPGGFVIVDDYGSYEQCRNATDDYRREHSIDDPIERIDAGGAYWRKRGGLVPEIGRA